MPNNFAEIIQEKLNAIAAENGFPGGIATADTTTKGRFFLYFYLFEFFMEMVDADEEMIEHGIVDKSGDLGIDFIHIDPDTETVYVVQAKYNTSAAGKEHLTHIAHLPRIILEKKDYVRKSANADLQAIIEDVWRLQDPTFKLIFVTDQKIPQNQAEHAIDEAKQYRDSEYRILDFDGLKDEYEDRTTSSRHHDIEFDVKDENVFTLDAIGDDYPTILLTQTAAKMRSVYATGKDALFARNIRYWLGKNTVNDSMQDTISKEPNRFFYYNNGITAVCDHFEKKGKKIRCINLQIINGAQTVTTIAKSKQPEGKLEKVRVLIRIIDVKKGSDSATLFVENIVKNNNSQTAVSISDFRSNDPIQAYIAQEISNLKSTLAKRPYYKHKREKKNPPPGYKAIAMQDLGKCYYSWIRDPTTLNASIKELWDVSDKGLYYQVFGEKGHPTKTFKASRIYEMLAVYYIYEFIKGALRGSDKIATPAILFKFHILWGVGLLLRRKYPAEKDRDEIIKMIATKGAYVSEKENKDSFERFKTGYYDQVVAGINFLLKMAMKKPGFVMRNYQRSKEFEEELLTYFGENPPELKELLPLRA